LLEPQSFKKQRKAIVPRYHAVVWFDHHEARLMRVSPDDVEKSVVHPANTPRHL
jgi:hypothetical protein